MEKKKVTIFYAWQSDCEQKINRHFIRYALDEAAERISQDDSVGVEITVDADTEGVPGTPPVSETILSKINAADIFVPDVTFVAETEGGKLIPNPNVMLEYGYALRSLTFKAMMPVMNTAFGGPERLPFDMAHARHPTQYHMEPAASDGVRRAERNKLSQKLEGILRLMMPHVLEKVGQGSPFAPVPPVRPPAFFFQPDDVLVNFGYPGEQELRFKRSKAIYLRLYPKFASQPRVGRTRAIEVAQRLTPLQRAITTLNRQNDWGAISVSPHGDGLTSLTQIFETGELWGISEEPFRGSQNPPFVSAIGVERAYVAALNNHRLVFEQHLKLRPPFILECGAVGLREQYLLVPSREFSGGDHAGPISRDAYSQTAELTSFDPKEWQSVLREFFIEFYDLAGCDRSKVLTDDLVAANELPPR